MLDLPGWWRSVREADLLGALLLAAALAGVILAFATADPKVQVFSDRGLWYLLGSAVAVSVTVVGANGKAVATVKADADGAYSVNVVDAQRQVSARKLKIGLRNAREVQALSGVAEGEQVLVGPVPAARARGTTIGPCSCHRASRASAASS